MPNSGQHWAASLAVAGLFLWLGLRWFERANLYFPSRDFAFTPAVYRLPYEDVWLDAADGARVHGWFVPGDPKGPVVLFCHGNAGNISHRLDKLRIFHGLGASVLVFDYRGYGRSPGRPTEAGTYRDADAAYSHLVEARGVAPGRIAAYGESLGAAVAVDLAARREIGALILESAFTSTVEMGRLVFPLLPVDWLVRFRYDSLSKLPAIRAPALVLHSPQDELVPYSMGRRLFEAAAGPKEFLELKGGHNEGFMDTGEAYGAGLRRFLEARIPGTARLP